MNRPPFTTLEYVRQAPDDRPPPNIPATISLGCGIAAALFMVTTGFGIWTTMFPPIARNAGWISEALAIVAIINGALGALEANRESKWYRAAIFGYGLGLLMACLTPIFFLL